MGRNKTINTWKGRLIGAAAVTAALVWIAGPSTAQELGSKQDQENAAEGIPSSGQGMVERAADKAAPELEFPKEPQLLGFSFDAPITYVVRGSSRMAIKDRDDLRQIYNSFLEVTYRKVSEDELPSLSNSTPTSGPAPTKESKVDPEAVRLLVTVDRARGSFEEPEYLKDVERTHQILRQAAFSYAITADGKIGDLRVHQPTSPLARASLDQMTSLASMMQPVFPNRPLKPGDTWTQDFAYKDGQGLTQFSQDSVNHYEFKEWRSCRNTVCAFITIKQEMKSSARMRWSNNETQGASTGGAEGWMLFDYRSGQVVKTFWKLRGQGWVRVLQDKQDQDQDQDIEEQARAEVLVEIESTAERVDRDGTSIPHIPGKSASSKGLD